MLIDETGAVIAAARAFKGRDVFNLTGTAVYMREVVAAIEVAAPEMRGRITFEDMPLPFPEEMDGAPLEHVLGPVSRTPLAEGVAWTVNCFRE
ncbi:MAG: hypothetical protein ACT4QE_14630 [Anaerolineales bacterium]